MTVRTCLITGANAGIGRAAALQLAERGHRVLLGCRDVGRGEEAAAAIREATGNPHVSVLALDVSSPRAIEAAATRLAELDVLIHNAAYFDLGYPGRGCTEDGVETTWATNVLGPVLLTERLLPLLQASPSGRVVAVSSKGLMMYPRLAVDLDDPEFAQRRFTLPAAYYQSKLAHVAWMLHLAETLRDTSVKVHGIHVTNVRIDLARYPELAWYMRWAYAIKSRFAIEPAAMAETYTWLAVDDEPGTATGGYWDRVGVTATVPRWARSPDHRRALVAYVRAQLGLSEP